MSRAGNVDTGERRGAPHGAPRLSWAVREPPSQVVGLPQAPDSTGRLTAFGSPAGSESQRVISTLFSVKKRTPSLPVACRSPQKEVVTPLKGKNAFGAATPTLTPSIPASTRSLQCLTAAPSSV